MKIDKVNLENVEEIARLHQQNLPSTSSKIGREYLKKLYKLLIQNPRQQRCLALFENGKVVGVISGTDDIEETTKMIKNELSIRDYLAILKALATFEVTPIELFQKIRLEIAINKKFSKPYSSILTFFVVKDYRRKGIGKKLINKYVQLFGKNRKYIYVDTLISNKRAQAFYRSNGFKLKEKIANSYVFQMRLK